MWNLITDHISQVTDQPFKLEKQRSVSGGCINQGYALIGKNLTYFVKVNRASKVSMFEAEAQGLQDIIKTQTIRAPQPICWGIAEESSYLVLEWLEFGGGSSQSWEEMGQKLAAMHQQGTASCFGWNQDNTIGSTPQSNT